MYRSHLCYTHIRENREWHRANDKRIAADKERALEKASARDRSIKEFEDSERRKLEGRIMKKFQSRKEITPPKASGLGKGYPDMGENFGSIEDPIMREEEIYPLNPGGWKFEGGVDENGRPSGQGKIIFPDHTSYTGYWEAGISCQYDGLPLQDQEERESWMRKFDEPEDPNWPGWLNHYRINNLDIRNFIMTLEDGNWYEGEGWERGRKHSIGRLRKGVLFYSDGSRYHGGFFGNSTQELTRQGWGTLYNSDGTTRLAGFWFEGKIIPAVNDIGRKTGKGSGKNTFIPGMGGIWDSGSMPGRSFHTGPGFGR